LGSREEGLTRQGLLCVVAHILIRVLDHLLQEGLDLIFYDLLVRWEKVRYNGAEGLCHIEADVGDRIRDHSSNHGQSHVHQHGRSENSGEFLRKDKKKKIVKKKEQTIRK